MAQPYSASDLAILYRTVELPLAAKFAVEFALVVTRWKTRHATRKNLAELDDHMLWDIGLTREEAQREAQRPFWD